MIYILTLDKKTTYQKVERYRLKVAYTLVTGEKVTDLNEEELNSVFDVSRYINEFKLSPEKGAIGCTLGHQKIYDLIAKGSEEIAIILEDDFQIVDVSEMLSLLQQKNNWDILLLGYSKFTEKNVKIYNLVNPIVQMIMKFGNRRVGYRHKLTTSGTVGYAITRSACKRIVGQCARPWYVADQWDIIAKYYNLKIASVDRPFVFEQDGVRTSNISSERQLNRIRESEFKYRYTFLDHLKLPVRLLKYALIQFRYKCLRRF